VIDFTGRYIYVDVGFGKNDRDYFTLTDLYVQEGAYFSEGEWLASDGGFVGDGPVRYSHNNPGNDSDKVLYNIAFREVRTTVETAFNRVAQWFPLLGQNKDYLHYNEELITVSIHAASRLHNYLMNTYNLNYDSLTNPANYFQSYY
jgi:hypothetical protein